MLGYDSADPLAQAIAERIAVNAKEAGISITPQALPQGAAARAVSLTQTDAVIARIRIASAQPAAALINMLATAATITESTLRRFRDATRRRADRERAVMKSHRIVPLDWVPQVYGLSARVRDWKPPAPGETWPFADVWLDPAPQESQ